ncbi:MAG: cadherin-like domain-containing protein, partial [Deltaproteobacteria bacterium]|nr:cadherin-like domain-containing protein [Deltaproteobacteria bacterium]
MAVPDAFTARSGLLEQIEAPGVMENDYDSGGEPPPPPTALAYLVSDVTHGVLFFNGDGSFDYTSDLGYAGIDTFSYYFVDASGTSNTALVTITVDGCEAGVASTQWVCWVEQAYLTKAAELGLSTFVESFEDDVVWGATRAPVTAPSVTSQSITWASNFGFNEITTASGAARSGNWGGYSLPHGDMSGPPGSRTHDGFTGTASSPDSLLGFGGWVVASQIGSRVDLIVTYDGGATTTVGFPDNTLSYFHKFFGFIDTAGFTSVEVVETDGTVDQPFFIFGDDFSMVVSGADTTPPQVVEIASWEETGDATLSEGESTDVAITELMVRFSEAVQDLAGD